MQAVTERDRWLALGLLAAVVAAAYFVFVHPWWTLPMRDADARIEALQERDARANAQLAQSGEIARRLEVARALDARAPVFLPEATVVLATAALWLRLVAEVGRTFGALPARGDGGHPVPPNLTLPAGVDPVRFTP